MTSVARLGATGLIVASLAGCATPPPADDPDAVADFKQTNDPLEPTNRVLYKVNQGLDFVLLRPLAVGYEWAVPPYVRARVHNVLGNLSSPVVLANDMIQAKPRRAGDTLARMVINTTVGLGGIFDVATDLGYPYHDANFGQTLALYGVPAGPYLFLPILGPGSPRDSGGYAADYFLDPVTWVGFYYKGAAFTDFTYARFGATIIDVRSELLDTLDKATEQALDPYATVRSLYRQHRDAGIEAARNDNRATTPAWYPAPESH
jgi:phospholipid-binding lipoprotein MlaA